MLSVVIPALNEEQNVRTICRQLTSVLESCADEHEVLFVDDGSTDGTRAELQRLAAEDPRVGYLFLSRRFGHEVAIAAGLDRARGDAVVVMDADLQDPPEVIGELVARWREGVHVAYARRRSRRGESAWKRGSAYLFYRVLARVADVDIPADTGNFRLMDRRVVEVVRGCREAPRFLRGLVSWAGFRQEAVDFDREPRRDGRTGYSAAAMLRLALTGLFSFSSLPLRLVAWLGSAAALLGLGAGVAELAHAALRGVPARGVVLLGCLVVLVSGVQLAALGLIGTYIGAIFKNGQGRPLYVVAEQRTPGVRPAAVEVAVRKHGADLRPVSSKV